MSAILDNLTPAQRAELAAAKRAEGRRSSQEAYASFERCDTDGFMSQWASGVTATVREAEAVLIENGGLVEVEALFDLEGNLVSTHNFMRTNQFSHSEELVWRTSDDFVARGGKRFLTLSEARKGKTRYVNDEKKGVRVGLVRVRGTVQVRGAYNAARGVAVPLVDDLKAGHFDVVTTDKGIGKDY